jgi:hypothetical protein
LALEIHHSLELPTLMADVQGPVAIQNTSKNIIRHLPIAIFLTGGILKGLNGCYLFWT